MLVDITTDAEWSEANSTPDNPPVLARDGVTVLHVTGATRNKNFGNRRDPPPSEDQRLSAIATYWKRRMELAESDFRRAKQILLDQARFCQLGPSNVPPQHDWKQPLGLARDTVFAFRKCWLETEKLREATPEGVGRRNAMLIGAERSQQMKWTEMEIANFTLDAAPDEPAPEVSP